MTASDLGINNASPRIAREALRPLQVVILFIFAATVGGGYLLLSAVESRTLVDGAIAWQANSPLRAVVQTLCLNYEFPTINAGDAKNYVLGIGAGLALLALTIAILSRTPERAHFEPSESLDSARERRAFPRTGRFGALAAAQALVGCYVLWSFSSARWSSAPPLAIGGSLLLAIFFLWSFCLSHGLGHAGAKIATRVMTGLGAVSALVAIWYYYGRNPVLSAKFPFGNPSFLATCLIPPIVLAAAIVLERSKNAPRPGLAGRRNDRGGRRLVEIVLAFAAIAICAWAFVLTRSRGPAVGLGLALIALWFFAAHGKWKTIPLLAGLLLVAIGIWYIVEFANAPSATGRSATMRSRFYTWEYAWRMFLAKPFTGAGQGGFALHGDTYVADDIMNDPLAFIGRSAHAHNEWLEVLSDLGAVGLILLGGALLLTIWAGMQKLRASEHLRWPLIGSLSALVGLCVAECFGVGLQIAEVPTAFYSMMGLIWALSAPDPSPALAALSVNSFRRMTSGVVGGLLGVAVMVLSQTDFSAARSAYAAVELLKADQGDQAIERAADSILRLSPQRVLENHYRLIQAHLAVAEKLMLTAVDRAARALQTEPPNERLQLMAQQDLQAADEHTTIASQQLKELVSRSPGYIGHGRLEARINLIRAESAATRGDTEARDAFARNAAAAIERELRRQPFDSDLAVEYGRIAATIAPAEDVLTALSRPLRHNRVTEGYIDLLERLMTQTDFQMSLDAATAGPGSGQPKDLSPSPRNGSVDWWPERLRLSAAAKFLRGEFQAAAVDLAPACQAYEQMPHNAPMGAAACFAEQADALFFARPDQSEAPVRSAERAIEYAPESEAGRQLKSMVQQRMVHYLAAAGDEHAAIAMLELSAPAGVSATDVEIELAMRTRRMIDSVVRTRREWLTGTEEGKAMLERLNAQFEQCMRRLKDDAPARMLAAQLALLRRNADGVADSLRRGLDLGMEPAAAESVLKRADEAGLTSPALTILQQAIEGAMKEAQPSTEEVTPPAEGEVTPPRPSADEDGRDGR